MSRNPSPADIKQTPFSHCTTTDIEYEYDLTLAPKNQKLIVLTIGGVALMGTVTGDPKKDADIVGFYPLPSRNKAREEQIKQEGTFPWTKSAFARWF